MTISATVLDVILKRLQNAPLPGIKATEIGILPEGKVPASVGQKYITIHSESLLTINPNEEVRKRRLRFAISIIRRIRDIPNDRFGIIYTDREEMANTHEIIMDLIESLVTLNLLAALPANALHSITRTFVHLNTNLDPIHLYPSYFLTPSHKKSHDIDDERVDDKIAGYKTVSFYQSPVFILNDSPLQCN